MNVAQNNRTLKVLTINQYLNWGFYANDKL